MSNRTGLRDALLVVAGAAALLVVFLVALRFREDPLAALAARSRRLDAVQRIRRALDASTLAEKSAVLAVTDEESKTFADEARAATKDAESARAEISGLPAAEETDLAATFDRAFAEFRRVDVELLDLAVKNTNLKAYATTYGPAAAALDETTAALARVAAANADSPEATRLALGAEVAALRVQTLLPPHVAEESDAKMTDLEARMTVSDSEARADLEALATRPRLADAADVATARAAFGRYDALRAEVLKLSRENTNVRSLAISLHEKRRAAAACDEALDALERAVRAEPTPAAPVSPR